MSIDIRMGAVVVVRLLIRVAMAVAGAVMTMVVLVVVSGARLLAAALHTSRHLPVISRSLQVITHNLPRPPW